MSENEKAIVKAQVIDLKLIGNEAFFWRFVRNAQLPEEKAKAYLKKEDLCEVLIDQLVAAQRRAPMNPIDQYTGCMPVVLSSGVFGYISLPKAVIFDVLDRLITPKKDEAPVYCQVSVCVFGTLSEIEIRLKDAPNVLFDKLTSTSPAMELRLDNPVDGKQI